MVDSRFKGGASNGVYERAIQIKKPDLMQVLIVGYQAVAMAEACPLLQDFMELSWIAKCLMGHTAQGWLEKVLHEHLGMADVSPKR